MAWPILLHSVHLAGILSKTFAPSDTVFGSPVKRYLQVFLSLYRVNREISKFCSQIIFVCGSETGFLAWVRKNTRR